MEKQRKKLVLIDGNAIVHRAYHALPPLTNKKGELLNAVYGFTSVLLKVINELKPDYILVSFDLKGKTFRHEEYKEYKATRVKAPDELYHQFDRVKEIVRAFNVPIYEKEGFEADDVIGTMARQAEEIDGDLYNTIVTGDLDTLQLVSPRTEVYALRRGMSDVTIYDEKAVEERYGGLKPGQMIDYKGLCGDQSDNIPGVKGIGEKTAINLIKEFGSIENIYKSIGEVKGAAKEKLERGKMNALMSKKLATIVRDVPVKLNLEEAVTHEFDRKKVTDLFQELNFFSLVKRIPENLAVNHTGIAIESLQAGEVKDFKFELISDEKLDNFFNLIKKQKEIAIFINSNGDKFYNCNVSGIAICYKKGRAGYIENSKLKTQNSKLKEILEDSKINKIGYNLKFDIEILEKTGIELKGGIWDVMLAAYVLNPGSKIELENLVLAELGEEIPEENKKGQLGLQIETPEQVAEKVCRKADYIFKLKEIYEKKIGEISKEQGKNNLESVFLNIEMPLVKILAQMETAGVAFNPVIFSGISEKIEKRIYRLEEKIYTLAGMSFNINSPRQLAEVLFEKLKLPTGDIKKGKTGYSTASGELFKLRKEHRIIEKIEEYRELFKLKTTYLDTLPTLVDENSRIHTDFNQAVTATGRLSSSNPNLQNIPIKTELGQLLRNAFVSEAGWSLISADYSQIDLRVVAHVSNDQNMIEAFRKGEDIHRATAALINKVPLSQVTEKMRSRAKALNFGIIYGMSVFGFSERTGIDRDEAKEFINAYMEKFSGVAKYMKGTKEFAKKNLYVETQFGRRRYIPEINSPNFQLANAGERMAINMPIQGMAADIMKLAMIKIHEEFRNNPNVRMVLQVHDEIILEAKEEIADEVAKKTKEIMENVYKLKAPLLVEVGVGKSWGEI